jgi:hypothetical protein
MMVYYDMEHPTGNLRFVKRMVQNLETGLTHPSTEERLILQQEIMIETVYGFQRDIKLEWRDVPIAKED